MTRVHSQANEQAKKNIRQERPGRDATLVLLRALEILASLSTDDHLALRLVDLVLRNFEVELLREGVSDSGKGTDRDMA